MEPDTELTPEQIEVLRQRLADHYLDHDFDFRDDADLLLTQVDLLRIALDGAKQEIAELQQETAQLKSLLRGSTV